MSGHSKQKSSIVWKFFKEDPTNRLYAVCLIWEERIKRGISIPTCSSTPLNNHLRRKHPNELSNEAVKRKADESMNQPPLKQLTIRTTESATVALFPPNCGQSLPITQSIAKMVALDCQPFSIVDDEGFKTLMKIAKPRYQMPTRRKITEMIEEAYKLQVQYIKKELSEDTDHTNVTTDIWSSRNMGSYIGVTGHWTSKATGELKVRCLAVRPMSGSHTGENIDAYLKTVFNEYEISAKVFIILRDNAANMARAMRVGGYATYGYFAHSEQLCLAKVYEHQRATNDMVHRVRKIVSHFHKSGKATEELRQIQASLNLPQHKLIQDVETRWNSTYYMLKRIIEQRAAISQYLEDHEGIVASLDGNDWKLAKALTTVFQTFEEATRAVSEANATISLVIPIIDVLRSTLERLEDSGVGTVKGEVLQSLEERFGDVEDSPLLLVATILDPRYKDRMFSSADICQKAKDEVLKLVDEIEPVVVRQEETCESETQPDAEKVTTIWEKMTERMKRKSVSVPSGSGSSIEVALNMYCSEEVIPLRGNGSDPFEYWHQKKSLWPKLAALAAKYLSVPPGSVYSERLFSSAGLIDCPNRARLTGDHLEKLTMLKVNAKLWPW